MYRLEILKKDQNTIIYVYENDKLVESYSERIEEPRLEGNIYLGIVKDVSATFVDTTIIRFPSCSWYIFICSSNIHRLYY